MPGWRFLQMKERDSGKEADSDDGGGMKKRGEGDEETGREERETRNERTEGRCEKRGNEKEMKKRTERDGLSSFAYLLHYSE